MRTSCWGHERFYKYKRQIIVVCLYVHDVLCCFVLESKTFLSPSKGADQMICVTDTHHLLTPRNEHNIKGWLDHWTNVFSEIVCTYIKGAWIQVVVLSSDMNNNMQENVHCFARFLSVSILRHHFMNITMIWVLDFQYAFDAFRTRWRCFFLLLTIPIIHRLFSFYRLYQSKERAESGS